MKRIADSVPLYVSTVLSLAVALAYPFDHILLQESPKSARLTLSVIVFLVALAALFPFWLPTAIPGRARRTRRIAALGCGLILVVGAFALCVFMISLQMLSPWLFCVALAASAAGIWHLAQHFGKETLRSDELQR